MASWQFILVGVLAAVALTSAVDCEYEGKTFADGSKFKLPTSGNCIEYTCTNGGFKTTKKECEQGSSCFPLGHESVNNCYTTVCQQNDDGRIGFINKEIKCSGDEGKCFSPGEEFTKTYQGTVYSKTTCTVEGNDVNYAFRN
ncbi:hypothetical protein LOTGIDRAFT_230690 [Lottia gigantea]|uniref:Sushi domain-containing protein n=1 Tax=Lottia gigantea TaxID=225164 RepID=V4B5S1_LOTGI|nr:hypothetical protein LOTGIDRAFT_230690 [Lottia gigantea]ESP01412.1 hypothetical protein LOTGIDRAFT_230690 [Lottia gigantea]